MKLRETNDLGHHLPSSWKAEELEFAYLLHCKKFHQRRMREVTSRIDRRYHKNMAQWFQRKLRAYGLNPIIRYVIWKNLGKIRSHILKSNSLIQRLQGIRP